MHPDLATIWWYEYFLSFPDVSDDVISHFASELPSSPASGMPAPVCCRLNLRLLKAVPLERFDVILELLGFISGLVKCYPGQFRKDINLQLVVASSELLAEVLYSQACVHALIGIGEAHLQPCYLIDGAQRHARLPYRHSMHSMGLTYWAGYNQKLIVHALFKDCPVFACRYCCSLL